MTERVWIKMYDIAVDRSPVRFRLIRAARLTEIENMTVQSVSGPAGRMGPVTTYEF